ncbi:MAG: hypothetical protein V1899_02945 [Planctomycetota bacterium]
MSNTPTEAELKLAQEIADRLEVEHFIVLDNESDATNIVAALLAAHRDEGELARLLALARKMEHTESIGARNKWLCDIDAALAQHEQA